MAKRVKQADLFNIEDALSTTMSPETLEELLTRLKALF